MSSTAQVYALIAAAGVGSRVGSGLPKQYLPLAGKTIIERSITVFLQMEQVQQIVVSVAKDDPYWPKQNVSQAPSIQTTIGGASRAESVLAGLQKLQSFAAPDSWVLVHDAARPLVRAADIESLIKRVEAVDACGGLLAVPVTDTIKVAGNQNSNVERTFDRSRLWHAQTPQLFRLQQLHDALFAAINGGIEITDEASALESIGEQPLLVSGRRDNIKITHASDLIMAEWLLQQQQSPVTP